MFTTDTVLNVRYTDEYTALSKFTVTCAATVQSKCIRVTTRLIPFRFRNQSRRLFVRDGTVKREIGGRKTPPRPMYIAFRVLDGVIDKTSVRKKKKNFHLSSRGNVILLIAVHTVVILYTHVCT